MLCVLAIYIYIYICLWLWLCLCLCLCLWLCIMYICFYVNLHKVINQGISCADLFAIMWHQQRQPGSQCRDMAPSTHTAMWHTHTHTDSLTHSHHIRKCKKSEINNRLYILQIIASRDFFEFLLATIFSLLAKRIMF